MMMLSCINRLRFRRHVSLLGTVISFLLLFNAARGDDFDVAMQAVLKANDIRGAAVAYYDRSRMSAPIARGYGKVAAAGTSANVDADTTFMMASVSKVFVASAVAVMVNSGLIGLDDDICNVKPASWDNSACRNPNFPTKKVTWRMMCTHRSSLKGDIPDVRNSAGKLVSPSYGPSGGYVSDYPAAGNPTCPLSDVQGFYRDILTNKPTTTNVGQSMTIQGGGKINWYKLAQSKGSMWKNTQPGATNTYSNFAFGYLPALIELRTGQSFTNFCKANIFQKLGMTRTAWFRKDLPAGTKEAVPVERTGKQRWKNIGHYCYIDYGSGELRTTARDLSKWGDAMLKYGAPMLWSENIGKQVVSCQERDAAGRQVSNCEFGLGWILLSNSMKGKQSTESWLKAFEKYDWTNGIWHDGSEGGSQTNIIVLPNAGVYVMVATNTDLNSDWAAQRMTAAAVNAPLPTGGTGSGSGSGSGGGSGTGGGTAGTCADVSNGLFWVNNQWGYKQCSWLAKYPYWKSKLCGNKSDASYYCRKTCNSCSLWNGVQTFNPEIKLNQPIPSTSSCVNIAKGVFWVNKKKKYQNCSWLSKNGYYRKRICGNNLPGDYVCRKLCRSCNYWKNK